MAAPGEYMFQGFTSELTDLNGVYCRTTNMNHGKPVFKKTAQGQEVMVYFWDDSDGPQLQGWWVAPEVGGQNVWAMNPTTTPEPPTNGWKVPWHGDVDPKVTCQKMGSGNQKRTAQNAWGNQATANQPDPKQGRWGNNQGQAPWGNTYDDQNFEDDNGSSTTTAGMPQGGGQNQKGKGQNQSSSWGKGSQQQGQAQSQKGQQQNQWGQTEYVSSFQKEYVSEFQSEYVNQNQGGGNNWNQKGWGQQETWGNQNNKGPDPAAERAEKQRLEREAREAKAEQAKKDREAEQKKRTEEKVRQAIQQISQSVANAEKKFQSAKDSQHVKAILNAPTSGKISMTSAQLKEHTVEADKLIRAAQSSITGTKSQLAQQLTQLNNMEVSPLVKQLQNQVNGFQTRCERALEQSKVLETQKTERETLLWSQMGQNVVNECETEVGEVEKLIEVLKDAAALLTSDLAEHLSPEETLKSTTETDEAVKKAQAKFSSTTRLLQSKQKELSNSPKQLVEKIQTMCQKLGPWNQEIQQLRKVSQDASRKASAQLEKKKREEEEKRKQRKLKRAADWNKQLVEDISIECISAQLALTMSTFAEAEVQANASKKTFDDYMQKGCLPNTKAALQKYQSSVQQLLEEIENKKKCKFEGENIFKLVAAVNKYMEDTKRQPSDVFRMVSRNTGNATLKQFQVFAKNSLKGVAPAGVDDAWARVDIPRKDFGKLTQEEFSALCEMYLEIEKALPFTENEEFTEEDENNPTCVSQGRYLKLIDCGKFDNPNGIVRIKVKDCSTEKIGWITIFDSIFLCKPCLYFKCIKETVLTEGQDMKGLKVVRRVKLNEVLRFVQPSSTGNVGRVKCQCVSDGRVGYITALATDNDVIYLKHEEIKQKEDDKPELQAVRCAVGEGIEADKAGEWAPASIVEAKENNMVCIAYEDESEVTLTMAKVRTRGSHKPIVLTRPSPELEQRIVDKCDHLITRVTEAEVPFRPLKEGEDYSTFQMQEREISNGCVKQQEYLEEVQTFLLQREVQLRVHQEVLSMICGRINKVQQKLNERRYNLRDDIQKAIADAEHKAEEEREAKELERQKEAIAERDRSLVAARTTVEEVAELFQDIRTKTDMDIGEEQDPIKFIRELESAYEEVNIKHNAAVEMIKKQMDCIDLTIADDNDTQGQYKNILERLENLNEDPIDLVTLKMKHMKQERDDLLEQVEQLIESKKMSLEDLFNQLAVDGIVSAEKFLGMFETSIEINKSLDLDEFKLLTGNYWYACHGGTATSELNVNKSSVVRNVEPFDIFRVIGKPETDGVSSSERIRIEFTDKAQEGGYLTCTQKDVPFCLPLPQEYTIKAQTVFTDKPDLNNLKVVKRLKVGERITPISLPHHWKLLLRVKGRCADGTEGWFTVVDLQKKITFVKEFNISR